MPPQRQQRRCRATTFPTHRRYFCTPVVVGRVDTPNARSLRFRRLQLVAITDRDVIVFVPTQHSLVGVVHVRVNARFVRPSRFARPGRRYLVENLLGWRSSIECLIRSIVVIVVSEPSQPAHGTGWTPSPERVKAVDSHHHGLEALLDEIPFGVVESAMEIEAS